MLKLLAIIFLLVASYSIVFVTYKKLSQNRKLKNVVVDDSYAILGEIKSNNTYPLILDVFTSLNKSLSECGAELHADLRGYLDHGKTE